MSDYQKETKFLDLGVIYIKNDGKKYATVNIGGQNLFVQLEPADKKFENFLAAGKMTQEEANEKIQRNAETGAKYRMKIVVDQ